MTFEKPVILIVRFLSPQQAINQLQAIIDSKIAAIPRLSSRPSNIKEFEDENKEANRYIKQIEANPTKLTLLKIDLGQLRTLISRQAASRRAVIITQRQIDSIVQEIADIESSQVTTSTSQLVLGSTIGAVSSIGATLPPPIPPFFSISAGVHRLKDNRIKGDSIVILEAKREAVEEDVRGFLITDIFKLGGDRFVHKINVLNFTATERDERITINETGNGLDKVLFVQFVTLVPQAEGQIPENRVSNLITKVLESQTDVPEPVQPPFLPPIPDPLPIIPPPIGDPPPMDEPPEEQERDLFQTAIIGAIGIGLLASLMGGKKK